MEGQNLKVTSEKFYAVQRDVYNFFENALHIHESLALTIFVIGNPQIVLDLYEYFLLFTLRFTLAF